MNGPVNIAQGGRLNQSLFHLLKRASRAAAEIYAHERRRSQLTQRQYALLSCLEQNEGALQKQVAEETGIDRSTLAELAARMEERGYIRREICPSDRRARNLYLTEKGREALHDLVPLMAEVDRKLLAVLPPAQRDVFLAAVKLLASHPAAGEQAERIASLHDIRDARPRPRLMPDERHTARHSATART